MRFIIIFLFYNTIYAQNISNDTLKSPISFSNITSQDNAYNKWEKFSLRGYGVVNYYNNKFDTDPTYKDKFDAERLNLYLEYQFSEKINFKSEIEFEHGGTGSTMELDTQEEFGEFEQEIEKGGEVKIEQLHINFNIHPAFNIRAGRMKVYFGLHQSLDKPTQYFTTNRQEMENEILPLGWYENGIEFYGQIIPKINYRFWIVNGLDSSGFSSRNWIKKGYQQRFELVNGESFALATRIDYKFGKHKDTFLGFSAYINDSNANRPKQDIKETAYVTLFEAHISYNENNIRFNTIGLYGNLENSDIVSQKNANLSNNLGVKRSPVGKNAIGFSAEFGYNIMPLISHFSKKQLYPFLRYDYYDTMADVEGMVVRNKRWQRSSTTFGANYFVNNNIVIKAQYTDRKLGSENYDLATLEYTGKNQHERTFSTGIGFYF